MLDVHMQRSEVVFDLIQGLPIRQTVKAEVAMGSTRMPIRLSDMEDGFQMFGVGKACAPGAPESQLAYMKSITSLEAPPETREFNVTLPGFDDQRAGIGWLRAAYLVAFAKLGYRYAYHPALKMVRDQIARCDDKILPGFRSILRKPVEPALQMMAIENPRELDGIAVIMRRHVVVLPPANEAGMDFYARVNAYGERNPQMQVSGRPISWPTGPEFLWDRRAKTGTGVARQIDR
jgi:hypothetical protein